MDLVLIEGGRSDHDQSLDVLQEEVAQLQRYHFLSPRQKRILKANLAIDNLIADTILSLSEIHEKMREP